MNKMLVIVFAFALAATQVSEAAVRALTPVRRGIGSPKNWWSQRYESKKKEVKAGGDIVLIGDSITHFYESHGAASMAMLSWKGAKVLNLGYSGDRTEHVIWRLTEGGELDGYKAKCIFLMIGSNNSGHFSIEEEPPSDTILGVRRILEIIAAKQPQAKIVLCSIFPRGADARDKCRFRNDVINREIVKFADGKRIFWCELRDKFLTNDARLSRDIFHDLLHPNALGYSIWSSVMLPYIREVMSKGEDAELTSRYASCMFVPGVSRFEEGLMLFPATRIRTEGYGNFDWWLDRLMRNRNRIADTKGNIDVVLMGDSITHNWERIGEAASAAKAITEKYSVLNLGYSGDAAQHLLWRAKYGELDGYKAKCISLLIGTNSMAEKRNKPRDIAEGVKEVINVIRVKQPQATILLHAIFPRGKPGEAIREKVKETNKILASYADGVKVVWVDIHDKFIDEKGSVEWSMPDRLHPDGKAHREIWLPVLLEHIEKICSK